MQSLYRGRAYWISNLKVVGSTVLPQLGWDLSESLFTLNEAKTLTSFQVHFLSFNQFCCCCRKNLWQRLSVSVICIFPVCSYCCKITCKQQMHWCSQCRYLFENASEKNNLFWKHFKVKSLGEENDINKSLVPCINLDHEKVFTYQSSRV